MNHFIPPYFVVKKAEEVINFCQDVLHDTSEKVICDASRLQLIDPTGVCLLAAICDNLQDSVHIEFINLPSHVVGYLAKMDLFKACGIDEKNWTFSHCNQQDVLVELQCLQKQRDVDECSDKLANAIVGNIPGLDVNAPPDEMTGYTPYECQSMGSIAV
jgi:ABC-type transporter Mla MlaB component